MLAQLHHEIYGTFAGQDRAPPVEHVEQFVKSLRDAGVPNDIHIYDPVQHGFWLYVERDPEVNMEPAHARLAPIGKYLDRVAGSRCSSTLKNFET